MKINVLFLFLITSGPWLKSWAISRVGTGFIGSSEEKFRAPEAQKYFPLMKTAGKKGLYYSEPFFGNRTFNSLYIWPLNEIDPGLLLTNRSTFRTNLQARGWKPLTGSPYPCLEIFQLENQTSHQMIMRWGQERGIMLMGTKESISLDYFKLVREKIELEPDACSWDSP